MTRPLCVAAASLCKDTWHILLDNGADPVEQTEDDGGNAIHVLIKMAAKDQNNFEIYSSWYSDVILALNVDIVINMLHHEDQFSLRPIELASHSAALDLMLTIFNTPGVYRQTKSRGLHIQHLYDITEYESVEKGNRREFSPLNFLQDLSFSGMAQASSCNSFHFHVMQTWLHNKVVVNRVLIGLWFLLRCTTLLVLMTATLSSMEMDHCYSNYGYEANTTTFESTSKICTKIFKPNGCPKAFLKVTFWDVCLLNAFSFSVCLAGVSIDLYEIISYLRQSNPKLKAKVFKIQNFYRVTNILFQVSIGLIVGPLLLVGPENQTLLNFAIPVGTSLGIWTILYFVQLLYMIGHYVIVVQLMLKDMLNFTIILFLIILPFVHGFHRMANDGLCLEDFTDFWKSFYTSFRMMLNMVDTTHVGVNDNLGFFILHFTYVFIVPILLINFLIATMSNTASEVFAVRSMVVQVQRLSVIIPLERRFHRLFAGYYRYMHRRCFCIKNDKIYIQVDTTRCPTVK